MADLLATMTSRLPTMVEQLDALVSVESPSQDLEACARSADAVRALAQTLVGDAGELVDVDGRSHLRWTFGAPGRAVLVGHHDTVWPLGTLARWPFSVDRAAGTATGPGSFDMKAGVVQLFHALSVLEDLDGIEVLLTCDEELGSQTSRALVEECARRNAAALVLEPSAAGAFKHGRKGTGMYTLVVEGKASHAGLEPEKGANALIELSHLVLALEAIARPELGTTVTPTVAAAGTATNVVPALATVEIDVRVALPEEAPRVDDAIRALVTTVPGTRLEVRGGPNRPPLPESSGADLLVRYQAVAGELGVAAPGAVSVGGGSDGNFTAAVGCPTLDGLGAVGDGAHAEGEHVVLPAMAERSALLAGVLTGLAFGNS